MGFGDKLKGLRDQAQHAVAENKDKIQEAVQNVGEAANAKTHGKYADKISKVGERVTHGVERISAEDEPDGTTPAPTAAAAPAPTETAAPVASGEAGASSEDSTGSADRGPSETPPAPPEFG